MTQKIINTEHVGKMLTASGLQPADQEVVIGLLERFANEVTGIMAETMDAAPPVGLLPLMSLMSMVLNAMGRKTAQATAETCLDILKGARDAQG